MPKQPRLLLRGRVDAATFDIIYDSFVEAAHSGKAVNSTERPQIVIELPQGGDDGLCAITATVLEIILNGSGMFVVNVTLAGGRRQTGELCLTPGDELGYYQAQFFAR